MDFDILSDLLAATITFFLIALSAIAFIFPLFCIGEYICYQLDKSLCSLYIDDKNIYSDRCHFLDISSIGENGNTKEVIIYKDILKLQPVKKYVSNNVVVKEIP